MDYQISFKNKKIWEFYDQHKNLDIENMNLIFIEILDKLFQDINPVLNTNLASQLLENMRTLQINMNSMNDNLSKSHNDLTTNFTMKFVEFKKEYIDDLKMILTNNNSDKIAPIIKQYNDALLDKTQIMINTLIPKNNDILSKEFTSSMKSLHSSIHEDTNTLLKSSINKENLDKFISILEDKFSNTLVSSQTMMNTIITSTEKRLDTRINEIRNITERNFTEIKDISTSNNGSQIQLQNNIGELLKKMENSSSKGRISENILYNIILPIFPTAQIDSVGTTKETGDIMMYRNNKPTILFENKNYDVNVSQEGVRKFIRDVEQQNCCGIMLAQHNGIANKENFQIDVYNNNVVVYLHNVEYNIDKIKVAVDIIDHFKSQLVNIDTGGDIININKDLLDEINTEYHNFATSKLNHIKTIKDFNLKLLSQIDDIKLPSLEQYLFKNYSVSTAKSDTCEYCQMVFKNQRALSAHYRGCTQKKSFNPSPKIENIVINTNSAK